MKIKMYANYNVRGRKYPIYHPVAQDISEPVMITIPDEWETYHNNMAELVIVTPDGARNLAYEIESDPKGPFFWAQTTINGVCRWPTATGWRRRNTTNAGRGGITPQE